MKKVKRILIVNIVIMIALITFLRVCVNFSISSITEFQGYWKYFSYRNKLEEIECEESRSIERWPRYLYDAYKKTERALMKDENVFVKKARNTKMLGKLGIFTVWIAKVVIQIFLYYELTVDIILVVRNIYKCIKCIKKIRRKRRR